MKRGTMQQHWKEHYPKDIPTEINVDEYHSIIELFHQSIQQYGDLPAYTNLGKTLTYNEIDCL
ncbi:MAG: long-chain-fatty-acid--CoA ligase, partial [Cocleimonas sp.]|nr:long-chain-fatty-acid--CoA ligase [Cocleimonas sp.]